MDEDNFKKFEQNQQYIIDESVSARGVISKDVNWIPPIGKTMYLVWENSLSDVDKTVSTLITYQITRASLPPFVVNSGLITVFSGLVFVVFGFQQFTPDCSKKTIIVGYIFAVLGGFIAIGLGKLLQNKEDKTDKFHGKAIVTIGIVATITFMVLYVFSWFI